MGRTVPLSSSSSQTGYDFCLCDYAIIVDSRSCALVAPTGSIDFFADLTLMAMPASLRCSGTTPRLLAISARGLCKALPNEFGDILRHGKLRGTEMAETR
jgi:hypothetical protein